MGNIVCILCEQEAPSAIWKPLLKHFKTQGHQIYSGKRVRSGISFSLKHLFAILQTRLSHTHTHTYYDRTGEFQSNVAHWKINRWCFRFIIFFFMTASPTSDFKGNNTSCVWSLERATGTHTCGGRFGGVAEGNPDPHHHPHHPQPPTWTPTSPEPSLLLAAAAN